MGYKIVVFSCLALALLLIITSEVAAKDLVETSASIDTSKPTKTTDGVKDAKYPGGSYGGYPGGGRGGYPGGGRGGYPGGGGRRGGGGSGSYRRGYCRYGCCRRDYYGNCRRCCSYAGQAMDAKPTAKPHN